MPHSSRNATIAGSATRAGAGLPIVRTGVRQEFRDVESDAAGADDRDVASRVAATLDDVDVARDTWMRKAVDRRLARNDAGREDHLVEVRKIIGRRERAEPDVDLQKREPSPEVAQRFGELLLARNAPREVELAADRRSPRRTASPDGRARRPSSRRQGPRDLRRRPRRACAARAGASTISVSRHANGLTRHVATSRSKMWSRHAWLQAMHVLISSARPSAALLTKSASARNGRAIDTMSASPRARIASATAGSLMRFVVISGTRTAPRSRAVTHVKAPRGTIVAIVGMRASCQPMPVLISVAPAASIACASVTTSSHVLPPSTRSSIDSR